MVFDDSKLLLDTKLRSGRTKDNITNSKESGMLVVISLSLSLGNPPLQVTTCAVSESGLWVWVELVAAVGGGGRGVSLQLSPFKLVACCCANKELSGNLVCWLYCCSRIKSPRDDDMSWLLLGSLSHLWMFELFLLSSFLLGVLGVGRHGWRDLQRAGRSRADVVPQLRISWNGNRAIPQDC